MPLSLSLCHIGYEFLSYFRNWLNGYLMCVNFTKFNHLVNSSILQPRYYDFITKIFDWNLNIGVKINHCNQSIGSLLFYLFNILWYHNLNDLLSGDVIPILLLWLFFLLFRMTFFLFIEVYLFLAQNLLFKGIGNISNTLPWLEKNLNSLKVLYYLLLGDNTGHSRVVFKT